LLSQTVIIFLNVSAETPDAKPQPNFSKPPGKTGGGVPSANQFLSKRLFLQGAAQLGGFA